MKKESLLPAHKKGVSEIVSYVLLIVIAVGASVLVYNLLSQIIVRPGPSCPSDTNLLLKDYKCSFDSHELNLTLLNKGLFSVDAAYVRVGFVNDARQTKTWINNDETENFYFGNIGKGLAPNKEITWQFNISKSPSKDIITSSSNYTLEVQPVMWDKNLKKTTACEEVVTTVISC